ncbi:MAG: hypothetical protein AAF517_15540, partial [Planctomycetota bacterium]
WFEPFGLVSPMVFGATTFLLVGFALRKWIFRSTSHARSASDADPGAVSPGVALTPGGRILGGTLGAGGGVFVAGTLWLVANLVSALSISDPEITPSSPASQTAASERGSAPEANSALDTASAAQWFRSLARTANRGFVRHLPGIGTAGDETEALISILNTNLRTRQRLAESEDWVEIGELESLQAITGDDDLLEDFLAIGRGELVALYRLQRNEKILTFFREEKVQKMIPKLKPSTILRTLEKLESSESAPDAAPPPKP